MSDNERNETHEVYHEHDENDEMDGNGHPIPLWQSNIPIITAAVMAAMTTGGSTYAFGLYGAALKKTLHLSQAQLDTISTANFCAGMFSWVSGLFVDTFGTKAAIVSGGLIQAIALTLFWVVSRQFVVLESQSLVVSTLCVLGVSIFLSSALITGSVFKIIVRTCGPGSKGSTVGAAKGYVGLGSGAYSCVFEAIRHRGETDLDFLPMAAFFCILAVVLPTSVLHPSKSHLAQYTLVDETTPLHTRLIYLSLILMATLIMGSSLMELRHEGGDPDEDAGDSIYIGFALVAVWLGPIYGQLCLPRRSQLPHSSSAYGVLQAAPSGEGDQEAFEDEDCCEGSEGETQQDHIAVASDCPSEDLDENQMGVKNYRLGEMLMTGQAWMIFWTVMILVGAGIVETNNMGQMTEALGFPAVTTSVSLSFFSVAQSFGRVVTGAISESALNWPVTGFGIDSGIPRPFFLMVAALVGFASHLIMGFATTVTPFIIGCTLSGLAFGMVWPLMVLIIAEVFGTENAGANYLFFDGSSSAFGALLLSKYVAQEVYDAHIDPDNSDGKTCYGSACFQMTHVICAGLSLTCVVTSIICLYTTRHVYNNENLHRRPAH